MMTAETKIKTLRTVFAALLLLSMPAFIGTAAAAVVSVVPSTQNVAPSSTFNVDVAIDPAGNLVKGVEINLKFDPAVVQIDSVIIGNFLGSSPQEFLNLVDNTSGTVHLAYTVNPTYPAVSSPGTYATLNFKVKSNAPNGASPLHLTAAKLANDTGADIPGVAANDGTVTVNPVTSGSGGGGMETGATPAMTSTPSSTATQNPASTPVPANTTQVNVQGTAAATTTASATPAPGFEIALAVVALSAIYLLRRGKITKGQKPPNEK